MNAWFSMKAAQSHGYTVCVGDNGDDVYATFIGNSNTLPDNYTWDDATFVGGVSKTIRKYPKAVMSANEYAAKHGRANRVQTRWE